MYPSPLEGYLGTVEEYFESTLSIIRNDLEFNFYPKIKGTIILKFQKGIVESKFHIYHGSLFNVSIESIIADFATNSELKIATGGHLILREVWMRDKVFESKTERWFLIAVLAWSEEIFTTNSSFKYPELFHKYGMAPFNGLRAGAEDILNSSNHGYGMSSVIKYLTDSPNYGKTGISKTYEGISKTVIATTSLLNTMDAFPWDWWPDFFEKYVSGNIYDRSIDYFLGNAEGEWIIDSADDTLHLFTNTYKDISAKMFKINLNYAPPDTSYKMLLSMVASDDIYDDLSLIVFGIDKNGNAEWLETAKSQDFEIPNLKSYYDTDMKQFLVVLVNSNYTPDNYFGQSSIDLTVRVKSQLDFTKCEVSMKVLTDLKYKSMDLDGNWSTTTTKTSFRVASLFDAVGSFNSNTFTGSYYNSGASDGSVYAGTISVTLNESASMVTAVSWSGTIDWPNGSKVVVQGFSGTGTQIPFTPNSDDNMSLYQLYGFTGANVCEGINDVNYHKQVYSDGELLYQEWIDGFSSDNQSELIIKLKKE